MWSETGLTAFRHAFRQEKYNPTNNKEQKSKQYREAWETAIEEYNDFGQATFGAKVKVEKGQAQLFYGFKARSL